MNILSKYGLLQYKNAARVYSKTTLESLNLFKKETKQLKLPIFLSYHNEELEELDNAINFLKNFGALIYPDFFIEKKGSKNKRDKVPDHVNPKVEKKISQNSKFIFVATENALQSKKCKWELRYANAKKAVGDIVILPIREDYDDYSGIELLKKYPYIHKKSVDTNEYIVQYPDGSTEELSDWLSLRPKKQLVL